MLILLSNYLNISNLCLFFIVYYEFFGLTSSAGVLGGAGVHYDPDNIRLTFDILYRYGLHNVVNRKNRFSENRLVGVGDVLDDLSLRNISINLGVLFPLRFLSTTFKSNS